MRYLRVYSLWTFLVLVVSCDCRKSPELMPAQELYRACTGQGISYTTLQPERGLVRSKHVEDYFKCKDPAESARCPIRAAGEEENNDRAYRQAFDYVRTAYICIHLPSGQTSTYGGGRASVTVNAAHQQVLRIPQLLFLTRDQEWNWIARLKFASLRMPRSLIWTSTFSRSRRFQRTVHRHSTSSFRI